MKPFVIRLLLGLGAVGGAGVIPINAADYQLQASPSASAVGKVVDLKVSPPVDVDRGALFVSIGGVSAEVESVAGETVRVKIPSVRPGSAEIRLFALSGEPKTPHRSGTGTIAILEDPRMHAWTSKAIVAMLCALVLFVLYRATPKTNADTWNRFMFLIYDDSTDSYSAKRLQAVLWFAAVLPVVLYAFVLTQFRTGVGTWLTLPANVLFLLGTSAATGVIAEGVERSRQAPVKSAEKRAAWQDLFQEREQFSFSRFQMICWTVVTCGFFLVAYWNHANVDPASVPDIPLSFWMLMGLSSATYVGAKLAEPASTGGAPQILSAVVTPTRNELIVRVRAVTLRFDMTPEGWFTIDGSVKGGSNVKFALDGSHIVTQQVDTNTHRMTLTIPKKGLPSLVGGSHLIDFDTAVRIHVTNPDGQVSADVTITC